MYSYPKELKAGFTSSVIWGVAGVLLCWFWFFASFNPLDLSLSLTPYDHKRVMQVLLVCMLALPFCLKEYRSILSELLKDKFLCLMWFLSFIFVFISSVNADNRLHSLFESLHWFLLTTIFCCGFYIVRAGLISLLIVGLLALFSLMVLKALLFLLFQVIDAAPLRVALLYPGVEHHRFFNQIQVFMIPLLFIWGLRSKLKRIAYFFLFLNLLLAFCGGARGLLVGLFGGALLAYLLLKPWRMEILRTLAVALVAFLIYIVIGAMADIGENADVLRAHSSGRLIIWQRLIAALDFSHFYMGEGSGAFSYHSFNRLEGHPHNSLLQFLYEWGILGTLVTLAAFLRIVYIAWQSLKNQVYTPSDENVTAALLVSVMSAAVYSLFSGIVVMPIPQTLFFLFAGLLWGKAFTRERLKDASCESSSSKIFTNIFTRSALFGTIAALLVLYVVLCGAYLNQQAGPSEEFRAPRFWAVGAQFSEWSGADQ